MQQRSKERSVSREGRLDPEEGNWSPLDTGYLWNPLETAEHTKVRPFQLGIMSSHSPKKVGDYPLSLSKGFLHQRASCTVCRDQCKMKMSSLLLKSY